VLFCKFQIYKIIKFSIYNIKIASRCLQICKLTHLQFDKLRVHVLKFTSLQITKLQDYKLHALVCKFQIYKIKNFSVYKIKNIKTASALWHIYKFAHVRFSCFHTCMSYKITKLSNFQLQNIKLQIAKLQVYKLHLHICKFQTYTKKSFQFKIIIKTKIASTCLQICKITKITNCKCIFAYLQVCTY
jgi:hypothetical protein